LCDALRGIFEQAQGRARNRIWALVVVDLLDEGANASPGFAQIAVDPAIDLLVLERAHANAGQREAVADADGRCPSMAQR
jgi:hypothetical protein